MLDLNLTAVLLGFVLVIAFSMSVVVPVPLLSRQPGLLAQLVKF
jgi:hypothetical protein